MTRRRTWSHRLADWVTGGDYSEALAARDRAVQTAASSPLAGPRCCLMTCGRPAEWTIRTVRADGLPAGPDPFSDVTEACTAHVGELLGHQPDARHPDRIHWEVHDLTALKEPVS